MAAAEAEAFAPLDQAHDFFMFTFLYIYLRHWTRCTTFSKILHTMTLNSKCTLALTDFLRNFVRSLRSTRRLWRLLRLLKRYVCAWGDAGAGAVVCSSGWSGVGWGWGGWGGWGVGVVGVGVGVRAIALWSLGDVREPALVGHRV
jgi:hypothetical protein